MRTVRQQGGRAGKGKTLISDADSKRTVSIITVVFNGAKYLREAIESVRSQSYPDIEYIVIDGGSEDGSIDILRQNEDAIDCWISEKDSGIYDAMNKGIRLAKGSIIGILNSDDRYLPQAVEIARRTLEDSTAGYCYGWARLVDEKGAGVGVAKPVPRRRFADRVLRETPLPHPTMFVRKEVYLECGWFNPEFKLAGDFDFIARIHKAGIHGIEIPQELAEFRLGGASQNSLILQEKRAIAVREGLSPVLAWHDWLVARALMSAKRVLPPVATGWLRAFKDLRNR